MRCEACNATGSANGAAPGVCPSCRGAGRVRAQQGFFTIERTCPTCGGTGRVITDPCEACSGSGRVHREKTLSVTIPRGVEDGTRIRLAGEGEAGARGGASGDLYIFVSVAPHRLFSRDGANLYCRIPIPLTTAALGGQIEVPTIEGRRARLQVPDGTQTGHRFRLRGKGMTELHGHARGDMFCEIVVETPVNLTNRQQELLREFEHAGDGATHPESDGLLRQGQGALGRAARLTRRRPSLDRRGPRRLTARRTHAGHGRGCMRSRPGVRRADGPGGDGGGAREAELALAGGLESGGHAALGQDLGRLAGGEPIGIGRSPTTPQR